jgi:hypothetical protein
LTLWLKLALQLMPIWFTPLLLLLPWMMTLTIFLLHPPLLPLLVTLIPSVLVLPHLAIRLQLALLQPGPGTDGNQRDMSTPVTPLPVVTHQFPRGQGVKMNAPPKSGGVPILFLEN